MRAYRYVGSQDIKDNLPTESHRLHVDSAQKVIEWLTNIYHPKNPDDSITVTFIVDTSNKLWINERHSEHILCAYGGVYSVQEK